MMPCKRRPLAQRRTLQRSSVDRLASGRRARPGPRLGVAVITFGLATGCGAESSSDGGGEPSALPPGIYELHVGEDEPRPGCINGALDIDLVVDAETITRYRIVGGSRGPGQSYSYSVFRDRITIRDDARTMGARWAFDGTNLKLSDLSGGRCEDDSDWTAGPFVLVEP
jgi:hypothetical protein